MNYTIYVVENEIHIKGERIKMKKEKALKAFQMLLTVGLATTIIGVFFITIGWAEPIAVDMTDKATDEIQRYEKGHLVINEKKLTLGGHYPEGNTFQRNNNNVEQMNNAIEDDKIVTVLNTFDFKDKKGTHIIGLSDETTNGGALNPARKLNEGDRFVGVDGKGREVEFEVLHKSRFTSEELAKESSYYENYMNDLNTKESILIQFGTINFVYAEPVKQ